MSCSTTTTSSRCGNLSVEEKLSEIDEFLGFRMEREDGVKEGPVRESAVETGCEDRTVETVLEYSTSPEYKENTPFSLSGYQKDGSGAEMRRVRRGDRPLFRPSSRTTSQYQRDGFNLVLGSDAFSERGLKRLVAVFGVSGFIRDERDERRSRVTWRWMDPMCVVIIAYRPLSFSLIISFIQTLSCWLFCFVILDFWVDCTYGARAMGRCAGCWLSALLMCFVKEVIYLGPRDVDFNCVPVQRLLVMLRLDNILMENTDTPELACLFRSCSSFSSTLNQYP